jgi:hypothetical protein
MSLAQQVLGVVQASGPGPVGVHVNVVVDVLAVVNGGFFYFTDVMIDFLHRGAFIGV